MVIIMSEYENGYIDGVKDGYKKALKKLRQLDTDILIEISNIK